MTAILDEHKNWQTDGGKPLVNGKVYFGVRSEDPKETGITIYSDSVLQNPTSNPQLTDSFGQTDDKIFVTDFYSIRVEDEEENLIYENLDNGTGSDIGAPIAVNEVQGLNELVGVGVPPVVDYVDKQIYILKTVQENTDAMTLDLGPGPVPIKIKDLDILAGQISINATMELIFNSTGPVFELSDGHNFKVPQPLGETIPNTGKFTSLEATSLIGNIVGSANIQTDAVGQDEIASDAVGQSELKTVKETLASGTNVDATLITGGGGAFAFWPRIYSSSAGSIRYLVAPVIPIDARGADLFLTLSLTPLTQYTLGNGNAGVETFVDNVYITASPPYNIGDGECHSFIFAIVNNATGEIEAMSHAPDPTWANNGPTCIRPEYKREGRLYRKKCVIDKSKDFQDPERYSFIEQEITRAFKNSDMALIPHPFQGNDLTGKTIILIDPCDPIVLVAENMKNAGENASEELFFKKYVTFGNKHLSGRATPHKDVMVVKPTWKNTNKK